MFDPPRPHHHYPEIIRTPSLPMKKILTVSPAYINTSAKDNIISSTSGGNTNSLCPEPCTILKDLRISNLRVIFAHININSLRNKFEMISYLVNGNVDILLISPYSSLQYLHEMYVV